MDNIFLTKGEFIQALKDYHILEEKLKNYKCEYDKVYYQRFIKVKSPLDYDIIGYKNEEPIRKLKQRSYLNPELATDINEKLDCQLEILESNIKKCEYKLEQCDKKLDEFEEPFRSIIVDKYINNLTYIQIVDKYQTTFPGVTYVMTVRRVIDKAIDRKF